MRFLVQLLEVDQLFENVLQDHLGSVRTAESCEWVGFTHLSLRCPRFTVLIFFGGIGEILLEGPGHS